MEPAAKKQHIALPAALAAALPLFLIPAEFVAFQTVEMVNTVIGTLLALAAVLLILMVLAEAANQARSAFLGSVNHDIRTPMNAIIRPQAQAKDQTFDILVSPLNYEQLQAMKQYSRVRFTVSDNGLGMAIPKSLVDLMGVQMPVLDSRLERSEEQQEAGNA